jgi:multiple sugar transport system substrate-binding protein
MNSLRYVSTVLIVLLVLTPGCSRHSGDGGDGITLTFWHSCVSSTVPALNELIARYEKEHPGIHIKAQYVPAGDALIQKLITSVQSGNAPDISWIHADFLPDLVAADAIYKIDDLMAGADTSVRRDLEDLFPALALQAKWKGTYYSVPMEATSIALLCNTELFRKAGLDADHLPATWDELLTDAKRLTADRDGDGKNEQVGFFVPVFPASGPLSGWMVWQWYAFLFAAGGNVITPDQSRVMYDADAGVQALTLWKNLYEAQHLETFSVDYEVAFASKTLAMTLDGPWNIPRWKQIKGLEWKVVPLPVGPSTRATVAGGEYLALFKQTTHRKEGWEFMKWMLQPGIQAMWSMRSGYLPVRRAVREIAEYQKFLSENPALKAYVDQLEYGQAPNPIDHHSLMISRHMGEAIEHATLGKQDPRSALATSAAKSNALLQTVKGR